MGENTGPTEAWNMAQATLKRLSHLLNMCSIASQNRDYIGWYETLRDLRRNLAPFIPKTEWDLAEKKFSELPKEWRENPTKKNQKVLRQVNNILDEVYIIYIKSMKTKGLLMPKEIDAGKSILDM